MLGRCGVSAQGIIDETDEYKGVIILKRKFGSQMSVWLISEVVAAGREPAHISVAAELGLQFT